jgi:hypothetical protein
MKKKSTTRNRTGNKSIRTEDYSVVDPEDGMTDASDDEDFYSVSEDSEDDGSVLDPSEVEKLAGTRKVFNQKAKERVDLLAKKLHRYLRWQSETNLPRTAFMHGITSLVKMQGAERTGVLIVLFLIMLMEHWGEYERAKGEALGHKEDECIPGYIERSVGEKVAKNIVKSLYLLITFEAFLRSDSISYDCLGKLESFMPVFLDQVIRTFPRHEGSGNNLIKNHLFLHLVYDIRRLGVPGNTNSAIGEMCHKILCKETGRRTNMSASTFERQTSLRYVENLTVLRAYCDHPEWTDVLEKDDIVCPQNTYQCPLMTVGFNYVRVRNGRKKMGHVPNWSDSAASADEIFEIIRSHVLPKLTITKEIQLYGKTTRNGNPFSCCPSYGKQGLSKQDWCFLEMSEAEDIPFHILVIFHLPETPTRPIEINGVPLKEQGYYALGHFAFHPLRDDGPSLYEGLNDDEGNRAHVDQYLVHRIPKWHSCIDNPEGKPSSQNYPPTICAINCDSIAGPCTAFPDIVSGDPENLFYFMKPVNTWGKLFVEASQRHFQK